MSLTNNEVAKIAKHLPDFHIMANHDTDVVLPLIKSSPSSLVAAMSSVSREMPEDAIDGQLKAALDSTKRIDRKKNDISKMVGGRLELGKDLKELGKFALKAAPAILPLLLA